MDDHDEYFPISRESEKGSYQGSDPRLEWEHLRRFLDPFGYYKPRRATAIPVSQPEDPAEQQADALAASVMQGDVQQSQEISAQQEDYIEEHENDFDLHENNQELNAFSWPQTITVPSHDIIEIALYSIDGKLAYKGKPTTTDYHLLTGVKEGTYIIIVKTKDKKESFGRITRIQTIPPAADIKLVETKIVFKTEKEIKLEADIPFKINKRGIVSNEQGVYVRENADPEGAKLALIPFNTHVLVHTQEKDWYFIESKLGVSGYVPANRIKTNMPDPDALLYKIQKGETPEHLAKKFQPNYRHIKPDDWHETLTILLDYNDGYGKPEKGVYTDKKKEDEKAIGALADAHTRANYFIWIPTEISRNKTVSNWGGVNPVKSSDITSLWTPKEKADAILKYINLGNYNNAILEIFRSAETAFEFIRIQQAIEETMTMDTLLKKVGGGWMSVLIGSIGPVLSGINALNKARAERIIHFSTSGYPDFVAETFVLFILSTAYNDDVAAVLSEIDSQNRMPDSILRHETVKEMLNQRGISLSSYKKKDIGFWQGAGEGLITSTFPDVGTLSWSMDMESLPSLFYNAIRQSQWGVMADSIGNPLSWADYLMLNLPSTIYGTGAALVSGISNLSQGQYEEAGRELVGPTLLLLSLFGVKSSSKTINGPDGPNSFVMPKFTGPIPIEVSRLTTVMQLSADASAVVVNLHKTIGKQGIIDVAAYARKNLRNTMFLQKNGMAGAEALWKAKGDILVAESNLKTTLKGLPAPKSSVLINLIHIFDGEVVKGDAKGFHHVEASLFSADGTATNASGTAKITKILKPENGVGVFEATIEVLNPRSSTVPWRTKISTFFPKSWSRARVIREITEAYNNRVYNATEGAWDGISKSGLKIRMFIDQKGFDVNTAFPLYE
ncbi:MAG: EndoU domain-containing protein [Bacteroidia bacterium]